MNYHIDTVDVSLRKKYATHQITLRDAARTLYECGWFNYLPSDDQVLQVLFR